MTWHLVTLTFLELETDLEVSYKCFLVSVAVCNMAYRFVATNPSSNLGLSS